MLKSIPFTKGMTCAGVSGPKTCSVLASGSQFGMFGEGGSKTGFLAPMDNTLLLYKLFLIFT